MYRSRHSFGTGPVSHQSKEQREEQVDRGSIDPFGLEQAGVGILRRERRRGRRRERRGRLRWS